MSRNQHHRPNPLDLAANIHPYHRFWGRVLWLLDSLWRIIRQFWSMVIVGGLLIGLIVAWFTTPANTPFLSDPRQWRVVHPLLAHPLATSIGVALSILVSILAYLAHWLRASVRFSPQMRSTYLLKPVDTIQPGESLKMTGYRPEPYQRRDADEQAFVALTQRSLKTKKKRSSDSLGILIVGRPTQGKTRLGWEAVRASLPHWLFIYWVHSAQAAVPFDFERVRGKQVVIWLDDVHEYTSLADAELLNDLPRRLFEVHAQVAIVAMCRNGVKEDEARAALSKLFDHLVTVQPQNITPAQADILSAQYAQAEGKSQQERESALAEFDGTPGSLRVGVRRMRDEQYPSLPENAKCILRAIKLLRSAHIYTYTEERVRAVAERRFDMPSGDGAYDAARRAACEADFLQLGAPDASGKRTLEPVADVYIERAIQHYPTAGAEEADDWPRLVDIFSEVDSLDADALISLGNAFGENLRGDRQLNQQYSENCFRVALNVYTRETAPRKYAAIQDNLGNAFWRQAERAEGDRQQQRRYGAKAIQAYWEALKVYTPAKTPGAWARTQTSLGSALSDQAALVEGDERKQLLEVAIQAYRDALSVYSRAATPSQWSLTQYKLGEALRSQADLVVGEERKQVLDNAIQAYQEALTPGTFVATHNTASQWASAQFNLGRRSITATTMEAGLPASQLALAQFNLGFACGQRADLAGGEVRKQLLDMAIQAYRDALSVYSRAATPSQWALAQYNLGKARSQRAELAKDAERRLLLGGAIQAYQAALTGYTLAVTPSQRALTQYNLGEALRSQADLVESAKQRRQLLDMAIQAYQAALTGYTLAVTPSQWALTQYNLGEALRSQANLVVGEEQKQMLDRAIQTYRNALQFYKPRDALTQWAQAQTNLGVALRARAALVEGEERKRLLATEIEAYQVLLQVYTPEETPTGWARTQTSLGSAIRRQADLAEGPEKRRLLQEAIQSFRNASTLATREDAPDQRARTQNKLGEALSDQAALVENVKRQRWLLHEAIQAYQDALQVYSHEDALTQWAQAQTNLGVALRARAALVEGEERKRLLATAIQAYQEALQVYTPEETPTGWARTQTSLGSALSDQAALVKGEERKRLHFEAIEAYQEALQVYTPEEMPRWALTQYNLGEALRSQADLAVGEERKQALDQAIQAYRNALSVYSREATPNQWALTQYNLGKALQQQIELTVDAEQTHLFHEMSDAFRAYDEDRTPHLNETMHSDWAEMQMNLGVAAPQQATLADGYGRRRLLSEAIRNYQADLRDYLHATTRSQWALTQTNLGDALRSQANLAERGERKRLLNKALQAYRAALDVYSHEELLSQWATMQYNLGRALSDLARLSEHDERQQLLSNALKAYHSALDVYSHAAAMHGQWARTQNYLGTALYAQAVAFEGDKRKRLLSEAIQAYRDSLTACDPEDSASDWAMAQNNLGAALWQQAVLVEGKAQRRLLDEAIQVYREALRVRTPMAMPTQWATTQYNLGIALSDLATLTSSAGVQQRLLDEVIQAYDKALTVYTEAIPNLHTLVTHNLNIVLQARQESSGDARLLG